MAVKAKFKRNPTKEKIHEIIFEADTTAGKWFDIILMIMIVASVLAVMLESVEWIHEKYRYTFKVLEWFFTIFFTFEYILRLYSVYKPMKYATSFFGVIDLLAILPTYLEMILSANTHFLIVIRALRLLRVFRIFKLANFLKESKYIADSLKASRQKIAVFLTFVLLMTIIIGSVMYLIEGGTENSKFSSIPTSIYWAIVTLTTVGYGDISPTTPVGQFLAAAVMIMGYAVIAVPTGIVSAEMIKGDSEPIQLNTQSCAYCGAEDHQDDADFCRICGNELHPDLDKLKEEEAD